MSSTLYYGIECDDGLWALSAAEAVYDYFQNSDEEDYYGVTVEVYRQKTVDHETCSRFAENAMFTLEDDICEFDPDGWGGPEEPCLPKAGFTQIKQELTTAIMRAMRDHGHVWSCDKVGEEYWTLEAVKEVMQED